jgi:hypothetical protein
MLYEPGLGTLPFERDRLASDEPNVWMKFNQAQKKEKNIQ